MFQVSIIVIADHRSWWKCVFSSRLHLKDQSVMHPEPFLKQTLKKCGNFRLPYHFKIKF